MVGNPIEKRYFTVDEYTGLIRTIGIFNQLSNTTVFGFDIRATDKAGANDGKSAITNVFVSYTWFVGFVIQRIKLKLASMLFSCFKGVYFEREKNHYSGIGKTTISRGKIYGSCNEFDN